MSNVIQFLESMGANAAMARMTATDYEAAIEKLDADATSRQALHARDHSKLKELLKGRPVMVFAIMAPQESPEQEENPSEGEGEGEQKEAE